jgi:hypothetical protein
MNRRWKRGILTALVAASVFFGCESWWQSDEDCIPAPGDCVDVRPTEGQLVVRSSINSRNPAVPVWVFRGDFENGDLVLMDTLTTAGTTYVLPADQDYSVLALYIRSDGDTVVAVDGDGIGVDKDDYCGGVTCYTVDHAEVDVRLN